MVEPLRDRFLGNLIALLVNLLFAAAALVLLAACANLAGLFGYVASPAHVSLPFAPRLAPTLTGSLARSLSEAFLLIAPAGAGGAMLGWFAVRVMAAMAPRTSCLHGFASMRSWRVLLDCTRDYVNGNDSGRGRSL